MRHTFLILIAVYFCFFSILSKSNETKSTNIPQVIQAIYNNDLDTLEEMLRGGMSPNDRSGGSSFIHIAVMANKLDVVKLFLKFKANLKAEGTQNLIETAIANRNNEMVRLLIDNGAYLNKPSFAGTLWRPPLISAVMLNDRQLVEYLLAKGADVNALDGFSSSNSIEWASSYGYCEIMQLIKNAGGDITNRDSEGCTAIMLAAKEGREQATKLLLEWGANVNERDNDGKTALMHACENGHLPTVELLLSHGADASIKARGENNARSYAGAYLINKLLKETDKSELEKCKSDAEVKAALMRHIMKEDETLLIKCAGNDRNAGLIFN